MEVVVVEYILSTIGVMDMKKDFHSVSATMKQDQEHTVMMWGYIVHLVCKPLTVVSRTHITYLLWCDGVVLVHYHSNNIVITVTVITMYRNITNWHLYTCITVYLLLQ